MVYLSENQRQQLKIKLRDTFTSLYESYDSAEVNFINDADGKIVAFVGNKSREEEEVGISKKELILCSFFPQYKDKAQDILRVLLAKQQKVIFEEDDDTIIGLMTRDNNISEIVQELGFVEIPLENYLIEMKYDENNKHLKQMRENNFRGFIKHGNVELRRQEIILEKSK